MIDEAIRRGKAARTTPSTAAERLAAIRDRSAPGVESLRAWARTLTATNKRGLLGWLSAAADTMLETLEQHHENADPGLALFLANRRDAMEAVALVLHHADEGATAVRILETVDALGAVTWFEIAPAGSCAGSDRIRQIAAEDPDAWWGRWA